MGAVNAHAVTVELRGATNVVTERVIDLEINSDMLEVADQFSLTLPWTPELHKAASLDAEVRVTVDDAAILVGYIDERRREVSRDALELTITGRDKGGRLVDESAPLVSFDSATLLDLAETMVAPWFGTVSFSNARNRKLIGRAARSAKVGPEPLVTDPKAERLVQPGESRAKVLQFFLERAGALGWSSADGLEFVIGQPNYTQSPQWHFFHAMPDSKRKREANVSRFILTESISERYSRIRVVGAARGYDEPAPRRPRGSGPPAEYGRNVTQRLGEALASTADDASERQGAGGDSDFLRPKCLIVADDEVHTAEQAHARAEREMIWRDSRGRELSVSVPGLGQGTPAAIYKFDKIARFEDEETGAADDWFITRVVYRRSRDDGERTDLTMVPVGTLLATS